MHDRRTKGSETGALRLCIALSLAQLAITAHAATPPTVDNGSGAEVASPGSAILRGNLTTGDLADVTFYWGRSDGGPSTNYEYQVSLPNTPQGAFGTNVIAGHGFTYYYICFASNSQGVAWSPAATNFSMPVPVGPELPVTTNLEAHYQSSTGVVLNGNIVTEWHDQSGNDRHATDIDNRQPRLEPDQINGLPAITFKNQWLSVNHDITEREAWVVFKSGNGPNFGPSWGTPWGAQNAHHWMLEPGQKRFWTDGAQGQPPNAVYQNGIDRSPSPYELVDVDQFMVLNVHEKIAHTTFMEIGGNTAWRDAYWDIAEIVVYRQVLSVSDADKVGGYLAQKYAIPSTYAYTYVEHPRLVNHPVTQLQTNAATLNGSLAAIGRSFDIYLFYGLSDGEQIAGNWDASVFMGTAHSVTSALSFDAMNLAATSQYFYAFYASNMLEHIWAQPSISFQPLGPPTAENGTASEISETNATLGAMLSAGGSAELRIYWGQTDAGTNAGAWQNTNSFGDVLIGARSATVATQAGTPYFYRTYAINAEGDDWADGSASFTSLFPRVSIDDVTVVEGDAGATNATLTLSLTVVSPRNVTMDFATSNETAEAGLDYTGTNGTLMILAGHLSTQLTLKVSGDLVFEQPGETFSLHLLNPGDVIIADGQGVVTILDDEAALVAYFPFDETGGVDFADAMGAYVGSVVPPASLGRAGRFGNASQFTTDPKPGSTARISSALISDNHLDGPHARTFSLWFNTPTWNPTLDPGVQLVSYGAGVPGGSPPEAFMICLEGSSGQNRIALEAYGWPTPGGALWGNTLSTGGTGTWNHLVAAYDAQSNFSTMHVYVNGVDLGAPVDIGNDDVLNTTVATLGIGSHEDGGWTNYRGMIDDLGVWSGALDETRIRALYALAAETELNYSLGEAQQLFDLYDAGSGSAVIRTKVWIATASQATGSPGEVLRNDPFFSLRLGESGAGVVTIVQGLHFIVR